MAINFSSLGLDLGIVDSWAGMARKAAGLDAPAPAPVTTPATEADKLNALKQEALANAQSFASGQGRKPTMADYYVAAEELGQAKAVYISKNDMLWNEKVYADLSGLSIDGFLIRERDISPTPQRQQSAVTAATLQARERGTTPHRLDVLKAMRDQQGLDDPQLAKGPAVTTNAHGGVQALENLYDLEGDDAIGALYRNIDSQTRFNNAKITGCDYQPITLLMNHEHEGASFDRVNFDGMKDGDKVVLTSGSNISLTNVTGGELTVGNGRDRSTIDNLDISGSKLTLLNFNNATINGMNATDSSIFEVKTSGRTFINDANFSHTTISMVSELSGATLNRVNFHQVNLNGVDLSNVTLNSVTVTVDGATLPITREMLKEMGAIGYDSVTIHNSPQLQAHAHAEVVDTAKDKEEAGLSKPHPKEGLPGVLRGMGEATIMANTIGDPQFGKGADAMKAASAAADKGQRISPELAERLANPTLAVATLKGSGDFTQLPATAVIKTQIVGGHDVSHDEVHAGNAVAKMNPVNTPAKDDGGMSMNMLLAMKAAPAAKNS